MRPSLSLAGFQLTVTRRHRWGFPCCVSFPCVGMPSPLPRRDHETMPFMLPLGQKALCLATAAFPIFSLGRLPH